MRGVRHEPRKLVDALREQSNPQDPSEVPRNVLNRFLDRDHDPSDRPLEATNRAPRTRDGSDRAPVGVPRRRRLERRMRGRIVAVPAAIERGAEQAPTAGARPDADHEAPFFARNPSGDQLARRIGGSAKHHYLPPVGGRELRFAAGFVAEQRGVRQGDVRE